MVHSSTESRALELLGLGISSVQTASSLGVSESAISQLLAKEEFATQVAQRRFENLVAATQRDSKVDSIEDKILAKLDSAIDMAYQPLVLAKLYQIVNAAKRRGQVAPAGTESGKTIVNIDMPTKIVNNFQVNVNNQVIAAGNQDLVTIDKNALLRKIKGNSSDEKHEQGRIPAHI